MRDSCTFWHSRPTTISITSKVATKAIALYSSSLKDLLGSHWPIQMVATKPIVNQNCDRMYELQPDISSNICSFWQSERVWTDHARSRKGNRIWDRSFICIFY